MHRQTPGIEHHPGSLTVCGRPSPRRLRLLPPLLRLQLGTTRMLADDHHLHGAALAAFAATSAILPTLSTASQPADWLRAILGQTARQGRPRRPSATAGGLTMR